MTDVYGSFCVFLKMNLKPYKFLGQITKSKLFLLLIKKKCNFAVANFNIYVNGNHI